MTSTSAGVRLSARAANRPPKPQPTITIRARPVNAPLLKGLKPNSAMWGRLSAATSAANRGGVLVLLASAKARLRSAANQILHPRLAQRHGLGGPEGARLQ